MAKSTVREFCPAKRGDIVALEFNRSVTYLDPQRAGERYTYWLVAWVTSVDSEGRVKGAKLPHGSPVRDIDWERSHPVWPATWLDVDALRAHLDAQPVTHFYSSLDELVTDLKRFAIHARVTVERGWIIVRTSPSAAVRALVERMGGERIADETDAWLFTPVDATMIRDVLAVPRRADAAFIALLGGNDASRSG